MILTGIIEINGIQFAATVDVSDNNKSNKPRAYQLPNGRWRGFKSVNGKQKAFGCHATKLLALEAAREERKPERKKKENYGVYPTSKGAGKAMAYRVIVTIARGRSIRCGDYPTWGQAILVRDVVARRAGMTPYLVNYEMPLQLISNAAVRSFIRDRIMPATADDIAEYTRQVETLNGPRQTATVPAHEAKALGDEVWRQKQPSRVGRSPFDTLEDE